MSGCSFEKLSKLLNHWEVYFSQIRIHEVGLVQLFEGDFRNAGSFSIPVLSSLVCGSQPQGYKMAGPLPIITSAFQLRQKVRAKVGGPSMLSL